MREKHRSLQTFFRKNLTGRRTLFSGVLLFAGTALVCGAMLLAVSGAVSVKEKRKILSPEEAVSEKAFDCILVLGCRVHADGTLSDMLSDRVSTGADLFLNGVSERILMSGDRHGDYDEVGAMKRFATSLGVPEDSILEDPAGFSTFESLEYLADRKYGRRILIVTQEYHLPRALYIAERMGLEAYGVPADLHTYRGQTKRDVREVLARVKDVVYTQIRTTGDADDR